MASNFADRIQALTGYNLYSNMEEYENENGTVTEQPKFIQTWMEEAATEVINIMPKEALDFISHILRFPEDTTGQVFEDQVPDLDADIIKTDHIKIPSCKVLSVTRRASNFSYPTSEYLANRPGSDGALHECKEVPFHKISYSNDNTGYVEEATEESPVWCRYKNGILVRPFVQWWKATFTENVEGDTENIDIEVKKDCMIMIVHYPTILPSDTSITITQDWGDDAADGTPFTPGLEHLVVLKACTRAKLYQIGKANEEEDIEVAAAHTNHMNILNQEYTLGIQNYLSGMGIQQGMETTK